MMASPATPQASTAPVTAAQILDAPGDTPAKTPAAGASNPNPPAQDDRVSGKLQLLIQREKSAVERERAANAKEAAAAAREQALADREAKIQEFESVKGTNPRRALELLGMSYTELTQAELNDGQVTPETKIAKVEEKFNSFIKSQEDEKRLQAEETQKQQEKKHADTITAFKGEIGSYLKANPDRYELIAFEQKEDLVYDVIDGHFERTRLAAVSAAEEAGEDTSEIQGEVLTIAQAADKVEAHLEKKYHEKVPTLKKVKTFLAPRPAAHRADKPTHEPRQTPKTLNNNLSATPTPPRKTALTDEERVAKAIAYAHGLRTAS